MDDDEFDFSDNDLDDLPANTLQQLETTAIHATQQFAEDKDASRDSDYGLDDGDEVVNLDDPTRAPRFGAVQQTHGYAAAYSGNHELYGDAMEVEDVEEPPRQSQADASKLLLRIKKLEQDKRRLNTDLQTATAEANKKAGEADNIRRRAETTSRTTEQRITAQQRAHKESNDKLLAERDILLRQLEQTKTSNAFDEYNTRQDEQMRRPRRGMPARPKPAATATTTVSPAATPKRAQKTLAPGDGFNEEDIVMVSPSKRREKSKAVTPKQANKRKRQITNDSPIPALQLSEPRERAKAPESVPPLDPRLEVAFFRNFWKDDTRFALFQRLLLHRCAEGEDRILEALTRHAFPSHPEKKLSSMIYDTFSNVRQSSSAQELALHICDSFFKLWRRCLQEKHYAPVSLILEALQLTLASEPAKTAVETTEHIVPLIVDTIRLVAEPVLRASKDDTKKIAALFAPGQQAIAAEIDVEACLELLYLIATSCASSPSLNGLSRFWRTLNSEFVLLLLTRTQPLPHMTWMLRILSTSALSTSLGVIAADEQATTENNLLTRLTNLFSEDIAPVPNPHDPSPETVPEASVWRIRLMVLDVLTQFAMSEVGATALAHHNLCIGRLILYLNRCVMALYNRLLSPTQGQKIASINASMKLLYHLATTTRTQIKDKLKATLGGEHAFHVSLTRLAYSDGLVLEAGIERQVMDMAHEILDEGLGPEEGEALLQVFPNSGDSV